MKVLHISSEKSWRGGEQQIAYLIEESILKGVECSVIVREGSAFHHWLKEKEIPHHTAPFNNIFDFSTALKMKRAVKEMSPDLIHVHSGKGHGIYALAYLLGLRTPSVLSRRVDFPIKKNPWSRFKYGLTTIKRIVTVSKEIAEIIRPALKSAEKIKVVYSGIDLGRFSNTISKGILRAEYGIPEDELLIGNTSALAPHKDYLTFLRACQKISELGLKAKYLIIGTGPLERHINQWVSELNMKDDVIMTGFRNDIPEILPELDAFLITSKTEGLGTSILDAFACEVPVIATRAGGIPELVKHEETGLLCDIQDAPCLAESVYRIITQSELKNTLAENALDSLSEFTKERTAVKTIEVYQEVLDEI